MVRRKIGICGVVTATAMALLVSGMAAAAPRPTAQCLSLQERAELADLMARYAIYADAGEGDAFAAMFTEDGELVIRDQAVRGRSNLAAMINRKTSRTLHLPSAPVLVKVAPDRVRARSQLLFMRDATASASGESGFAVYEDTIVKTPQGWRFQQRRAAEKQPVTAEMLPANPMPFCAVEGG